MSIHFAEDVVLMRSKRTLLYKLENILKKGITDMLVY
jgi:hypothetical protein